MVPDLCLFRWKGNGEVATRRNWKAVLKSLPGERPSPSRLFDRQQNMAKRRSLRWPEYILNAELLLDLTRPHDSNLEKMPTRYKPEIQYLGEHPTKIKNKKQSVGISLPNLGGRQFCPESTSHLVPCVWVARSGKRMEFPTSPSWNQIQFLLPDKGQKH